MGTVGDTQRRQGSRGKPTPHPTAAVGPPATSATIPQELWFSAKDKVMALKLNWAQQPKTTDGGRPGWPRATRGQASLGLPSWGGWTSQSSRGHLQLQAAPHQTHGQRLRPAGPRPPDTLPTSPGDPEGQRARQGQGRIRRACFSFTGASWVLMALLILMA